jgi:hypothetical protein
MIAGPPGLLAGALVGGAIGAAAGAAVGAAQQQKRDEDAALDFEIAAADDLVGNPPVSMQTDFERLSEPPRA